MADEKNEQLQAQPPSEPETPEQAIEGAQVEAQAETEADETVSDEPEAEAEPASAEAEAVPESETDVEAEAVPESVAEPDVEAEGASEAEAASEMEPEVAEEPEPDSEPERQPQLKRLIGRKVGMTQIFDDTGAAVPVTLIEAGPCYVTQIRRRATDGYSAVQLGFGAIKANRLTGGQLGHLKRSGLPELRHLREFRLKKVGDLQEGDMLTVSVFAIGDRVDVVGTSKGRGFAGAIKRHGFHRGPKTHGQSDRERAPGSRGATSTPGRVFPGSRGPGHMGSVRVSSQNLQVDLVDPEHNLLGVRGSVPGRNGGLVMVKEGRKQRRK